jgi:hypothetical protein
VEKKLKISQRYDENKVNALKKPGLEKSTIHPAIPLEPSHPSHPSPYYKCYHSNCKFTADDQEDYERHGALKHLENPLLYPSSYEIEKYGLTPQGKEWEI